MRGPRDRDRDHRGPKSARGPGGPRGPGAPRGPGGPPPSRPTEREVEIVYGLRAGLAVFETRREQIVRVGHSREARSELTALERWAATRGVPCTELSEVELARIAASTHHEGLCLEVEPRRWTRAADLGDLLLSKRGAAVALDRVRNPYNIGAILRSAAFFGLDAALLGAPAPHPALAPDAVRVAEGGTEHLALARTTDLAETLARLRARGVHVYGADGRGDSSAIGFRFERPAILVLGHEREGMSPRVRAECDAIVAIRGTGAIESLNVGIAASLLISELVRSGPPSR